MGETKSEFPSMIPVGACHSLTCVASNDFKSIASFELLANGESNKCRMVGCVVVAATYSIVSMAETTGRQGQFETR